MRPALSIHFPPVSNVYVFLDTVEQPLIPRTGLFLEEMDDLFGIIELARRMLEEAELENGVPLKGRKSSLLKRPSVVDII